MLSLRSGAAVSGDYRRRRKGLRSTHSLKQSLCETEFQKLLRTICDTSITQASTLTVMEKLNSSVHIGPISGRLKGACCSLSLIRYQMGNMLSVIRNIVRSTNPK